jgi:hypothetical protein
VLRAERRDESARLPDPHIAQQFVVGEEPLVAFMLNESIDSTLSITWWNSGQTSADRA